MAEKREKRDNEREEKMGKKEMGGEIQRAKIHGNIFLGNEKRGRIFQVS